MVDQGFVLALTSNASYAIQMILSGITAWRAAGSTLNIPMFLLYLVRAYAELGQFEQARRTIGEAMTAIETSKERLWEGEVHRTAGEIALMSLEPDAAKAEAYFQRVVAVRA